MTEDIRDRPHIGHDDLVRLNFIRSASPFFFRRYYRNGLRSHVMEVLRAANWDREIRGVVVDDIRWFPKARPLKMLRLFRRRFRDVAAVLAEIQRVQLVERYLTAKNMAVSEEFIAGYRPQPKTEILLCGLQEYVNGDPINPWHLPKMADLPEMLRPDTRGEMAGKDPARGMVQKIRASLSRFIHGVKTMILMSGHVPDLAGEGNLLLTPEGDVKLVDINNISKICYTADIYVDDIGYPVCDKSIEALSLLEHCLLGGPPDATAPVYRHFLDPHRRRRVRDLDTAFHHSFAADIS